MAQQDIDVIDGQPVSPEQAARRVKAEARAERIRSHLASAAEEYAAAVIEQDWRTLGYASPEEWREAMFAGQRLTVETRRQVHELLSAEGMGTKEIGTATGTHQRMVQRDLGHGKSPEFASTRQNVAGAPDQGERDESVTRKSRPKTPAQRMRESRERRRDKASNQARTTPVKEKEITAAHGTGCLCPACEEPRPSKLRDKVRAEVRAELAAACPACAEKDAEIARLSARVREQDEKLAAGGYHALEAQLAETRQELSRRKAGVSPLTAVRAKAHRHHPVRDWETGEVACAGPDGCGERLEDEAS